MFNFSDYLRIANNTKLPNRSNFNFQTRANAGATSPFRATSGAYSDTEVTIAGVDNFDDDTAVIANQPKLYDASLDDFADILPADAAVEYTIEAANTETDKHKSEPTPPTTSEKIDNLMNNLYGSSLAELVYSQNDIINSSVLASIKGSKAFGETMGEDYSGKYASKATIDFAQNIHSLETLSALGIEDGANLYANQNKQEATNENAPKVGDIVFMGDKGDPYHNGVVVAIKDGKYIVQEANSAKASKGGALVAYTLDAADGHAKHIQSFISIPNYDDVEDVQMPVADEVEDTIEAEDTGVNPFDILPANGEVAISEVVQKADSLVQSLYGYSTQSLLFSSEATNANPLVASIEGAKSFAKAMSELTGEDKKYNKKYSSQATIDFAQTLWSKEYLEENGIKSGDALTKSKNAQKVDDENLPKVGDIVLMGEGKDPYHSGVVVAITDDGKYVVQEGSSARAKDGKSQGGALVIYDTKPADGRTKYIQKFISLNKDDSTNPTVSSQAPTVDENAVQDVAPVEAVEQKEEVLNESLESEEAEISPANTEQEQSSIFDQYSLEDYYFDYIVADSHLVNSSLDAGKMFMQDEEAKYTIYADGSIVLADSEFEYKSKFADGSAQSAFDLAFDLANQGASSTMISTVMNILKMNSTKPLNKDDFNQLASKYGCSVSNQNGNPTVKLNNLSIQLVDGMLQFNL